MECESWCVIQADDLSKWIRVEAATDREAIVVADIRMNKSQWTSWALSQPDITREKFYEIMFDKYLAVPIDSRTSITF